MSIISESTCRREIDAPVSCGRPPIFIGVYADDRNSCVSSRL
ncbi:hypothetical protein ACFQ60_04270 [Streptomyces zhihengii]